MVRLNETADRIVKMMSDRGVKSVDLRFPDRFGLDHPITLDSGDTDDGGEWQNYEVYTLYIDMTAQTNLGKIDVLKDAADEDDLYTLEDAVKDILNF
jgi:hypothetical protein